MPTTAMEFEDYNATSQNYDNTRVPVGVQHYFSRLTADSVVLDAGCGTGNYLFPLAPKVKSITGFELNDGMISQSRKKAAAQQLTNVTLQQGSLLEKLPFEDNTFDAIVCNQVIHHIDADNKFPNCENLVAEFARILKPGGWCCFNRTAPEQMRQGWWMFSFIPAAVEEYCKRLVPSATLKGHMEANGLVYEEVIETEPLQGAGYYNLTCVLDKSFRDGDSTWAMVDEAALAETEAKAKNMLETGVMGAYFDKHDAFRRTGGQSTFSFGKKPLN